MKAHSKNIDIRALSIFKSVVENSTLTQASKQLNITPSAISQSLSDTESYIGTSLLDRSKRPAVLTQSGKILYKEITPILDRLNLAISRAKNTTDNPLQHINIEMAESLLNLVSIALLKNMTGIIKSWRFSGTNSPDSIEKLKNNTIDISILDNYAITFNTPYNRYDIIQEPYILAVPTSFVHQHKNITIDGLVNSNLAFVRYALNTTTGQRIETYIRSIKKDIPEQIEFDSAPAQLSMVKMGLGWGITTPLCYLQSGISKEDISLLPIDNSTFSRSLSVISQTYVDEKIPQSIATIAKQISLSAIKTLYVDHPWLKKYIS